MSVRSDNTLTPTIRGAVVLAVVLAAAGLCPCTGDGLPGEYLVTARWRDLLAPYSPLTNPAYLTSGDYVTVRGAFAPTMQGAFKLWESGVTIPILKKQAAGLSIVGENDGHIQSARFDPATNRLINDGEGESNNNIFVMLSYGIDLWRGLGVGANINLAYQSNFGDPVSGLGLDLGIAYHLPRHDILGSHMVGLNFQNLIAPSMGSSPTPDFGSDGEYSRDMRLSWLGQFWEERIESGLDLDIKDFWSQAAEFSTDKRLEWGLSSRVGFWTLGTIGTFLQLGFDQKFLEYWGLAAGVRVPSKTGRNLSAFYQYNLKSEGDLASSHTVYVVAELGKHRDELWSRRHKEPPPQPAPPAPQPEEPPIESAELVNLRSIEGVQIENDERFVQITAGEVAVHFASGSSDLSRDAKKTLEKIADLIRTFPDRPVSIEGHTDSDPIRGQLKKRYSNNKDLSHARAAAVKSYFVDTQRLPAEQFTTTGWGPTKQVAPNDTEENKRRNRRVVITIRK